MLRSILGIVVGYVAACLAAGATQVAFVVDPAEMIATKEAAAAAALLVAMSATQAGTFALPFAIIAIGITEVFGFRGWLTYAAAGVAIAVCGYWTVLAGDAGPALRNDVALRAFAVSGAVAGLVYWLVAGRRGSQREA
jgi:membrane protease YdiL (CAAX protease family)